MDGMTHDNTQMIRGASGNGNSGSFLGKVNGDATKVAADLAANAAAMEEIPMSERTPEQLVDTMRGLGLKGMAAAFDRAQLYVDAGADVLFVEAPKSRDQLAAIAGKLGGTRPLLANMVEGGQTPITSAQDLGELGFRLGIFPGGIVRALARQAQDYYGSLAKHGTTEPFRDRMFDFNALNDLIGTPAMLALGETYKEFPPARKGDAA